MQSYRIYIYSILRRYTSVILVRQEISLLQACGEPPGDPAVFSGQIGCDTWKGHSDLTNKRWRGIQQTWGFIAEIADL